MNMLISTRKQLALAVGSAVIAALPMGALAQGAAGRTMLMDREDRQAERHGALGHGSALFSDSGSSAVSPAAASPSLPVCPPTTV